MSARTKARKRAIDMLFAADVRGVAVADIVADEATRAASEPDREVSWLYAREVVDGVIDNLAVIDESITRHSRGWTLERMPAVDRAIVRVAVWEILFNDEIPPPVAMSEAVTLATELSTEESPGFINGLLSAISTE
ncbi:MAG: transcription antitermination factor NusB [Actinobacteria bacterium]|nr:transcription antitermination factor NusB [Actinomycetota bacterium]